MKIGHKPIILAGLCVALFAAPALATQSDLAGPGQTIPGTASVDIRARDLQQQHRAEARTKALHPRKIAAVRVKDLQAQHKAELARQARLTQPPPRHATRLAADTPRTIECSRSADLQNCMARQLQTAMRRYPGQGPYDGPMASSP